jgi:hypothetical protein
VFLKAPITTPQGGGFKSLNVTARKALGLYANVRPCVSYYPFVATKHPKMDVVIVRENEEDLYAGIEYRLTPDVYQCLKLITRPGSEKIVRYAFEYARRHSRRKVTCFTKDNIMKMTDGLFHKVFDEIGAEYPDVEKEHWIVDIGAAKLADSPEAFDVIVMPNLYGDILSDVAAQIAGSVGLAGSANIGEQCAMFEAIHGSAPRRAGQNLANPSGLLLGAVMMLVHIEQAEGRHEGVRRGRRRPSREAAPEAEGGRLRRGGPSVGRGGAAAAREARRPEDGRRGRLRRLGEPGHRRARPAAPAARRARIRAEDADVARHQGVARRTARDREGRRVPLPLPRQRRRREAQGHRGPAVADRRCGPRLREDRDALRVRRRARILARSGRMTA